MKTQIEKIMNSGKFCGVFTTDANKYSVGYLTDADGDFIRMERIDPYGNPDGVGCQRIDSITKIETETKYEKDIELLFLHKGHSKKPVSRKGDVLGSVLAEIQRHALERAHERIRDFVVFGDIFQFKHCPRHIKLLKNY